MTNSNNSTTDPTQKTLSDISIGPLAFEDDPDGAQIASTQDMDDASEFGANAGISTSQLDKEFEERFEKFYQRRYPGFTLSSGLNTMGHGKAELCLTTDTAQALHFYEQGNCKLGSRNSIELKTGDKATGDDLSVFIEAENGHIKISAPNGNLILQGNNVLLEATDPEGQVTLKTKQNLYLDAPSLTIDSDYATIAASSDMLLYGGNDTLVYCESGPVETGSGGDAIIATSLTEKILAAVKNAKMLFTSGAV
jgi:hypothetical protein